MALFSLYLHGRQGGSDLAFFSLCSMVVKEAVTWLFSPCASMVKEGSDVCGLVWSGLVWSGLVWSGLVWFGLV